MSTSLDDAMQDAHERTHGYDQEVVCTCGDAWTIRCWEGEPTEDAALVCETCGEEASFA